MCENSIGIIMHASCPEFDPHVRRIRRLGHEKGSTAILSLPLIQEEQLSATGERMCTKYCREVLVHCLGGLPRNSVFRVTDRARNDLKCIEGP